MTDGGADWLEHCRKPRERPAGMEWDVFISYRSADRVWALALYDMLRQAGYKIFLDQFVLTAGSGVLRQLSDNLARSASGVVIWSQRPLGWSAKSASWSSARTRRAKDHSRTTTSSPNWVPNPSPRCSRAASTSTSLPIRTAPPAPSWCA
jgi:hypothetical protein